MGRIRAFVQDDIPTVAEVNWRVLQGQRGPHPPSLEEYLRQLFFQNPWFDSSIGSLVYEQGQRVIGFLGIVPRPMSVNGKCIQAAFGSGLVVHPESRWALAGLQLLAAFIDGKQSVATRIPLRRFRRPPSGAMEEELEIDTLLHSCLPGCSADYSLRPEYNRESLGWLLDFMSRMKAYGNLRKVALRDATNEIIGWFIYYVKRGGIADVVQVGATKAHMKTVFDHLLCDAWNHGTIGLHGRL